jgi:hypothetical protein
VVRDGPVAVLPLPEPDEEPEHGEADVRAGEERRTENGERRTWWGGVGSQVGRFGSRVDARQGLRDEIGGVERRADERVEAFEECDDCCTDDSEPGSVWLEWCL